MRWKCNLYCVPILVAFLFGHGNILPERGVKDAGPLYSKVGLKGPISPIWADFELNFSELV